MTEEEVKQATCQVLGKDESGTGWLIGPDAVLTAYHCVEAAIATDAPITVLFGVGASAVEHSVVVRAHDAKLDVCLLQLSNPLDIEPVPFELEGLRPGEKWYAYGYPTAKLQLGHIAKGEVQQALSERVHGIDLDLSVEPATQLSAYHGLSGAALMVGAACRGMVRLKIDSSLGALSLAQLSSFLDANGLLPELPLESAEAAPIGARPAFDEVFESTIEKMRSGYVFLEGSHGVGKSTYCKQFSPESSGLELLGVYPFTDRAHGMTPALQLQPEVFFDWASSLLSGKATGKPARLMELTYAELIRDTNRVFQSLAQRYAKVKKVGVLFIDGVNEAAAVGDELLRKFVGLLPQALPDGLVVVITGVGFESMAGSLGTLPQGAERMTLPMLDRDIEYGVCVDFLDEDKVTAKVVAALCDRAKGHPLYLRYLADLVNGGASELDIEELPVFSGAIQDYYESIWSKLSLNGDAVKLLGIIARLRWGVETSVLTSMLTVSEAGVYPSTLIRIRHLLSSPGNTEIYHPSFSEYVVHRTALIDEGVHTRLAEFCAQRQSGDYGVLNKIFHGLRGGPELQLRAIQACQQTWVDDSVLLGGEPDILLSDIDEALAAATKVGTAPDVIRLLLLSQRLSFRYNVLFFQSAELVARALISLGKTDSAIRHVVRYGRLVVSAPEAFAIAHALITAGCAEQARAVLMLVQRELQAVFEKLSSDEGVSVGELLSAASLRMHGFALAHAAGENPSFTGFLRAIVEGVLLRSGSGIPKDEAQEAIQQLLGEMLGAQLSIEDSYQAFLEIESMPADVDPRNQLLCFLQTLTRAELHAEHYGVALSRGTLDLLLSDIDRVIDAPLVLEDRRFGFLDALIEAGAAHVLVEKYSTGIDLGDGTLSFYQKNRAEIDEELFESAMARVRATSFLEGGYDLLSAKAPSVDDWEGDVVHLARAVAWCDGKGRRAKAARDEAALGAVRTFIAETLLPGFAFPLASRVQWDSSYATPESLVPLLYKRVAKLVVDCLPEESHHVLEALQRGFDAQLGLYNEGFRRALFEVLSIFAKLGPQEQVADATFNLLVAWRDYVTANVENRHELVPELLQIVPLFASLGATEEATRCYQLMLSFSMGPSWYKEDQLSLMTNALEALPAATPVPASSLAKIAGLLEHSSGEMTFQRYVRADKGRFIEQLSRRSLVLDAVRYFQHQSCGTLEELHAQATIGNLDRVSPLVGMRFPGAALEEQAALLSLLRQTRGQSSWRLRWALLEVYQHGDERHLTDWGLEYAAIITELTNPGDLAQAKARVQSIVTSLNPERAWMLLRSVVPNLPVAHQPDFTSILDEMAAKVGGSRIEQLVSGHGLSPVHERATVPTVESSATESASPDDPDADGLFLPGMFGKSSAVKVARDQVAVARAQLSRRNHAAATQECLKALQTLQSGGWSIWSNNHSASEADGIISAQVNDSDELARLYGQLALEERYTERWLVAAHLMSLVGGKATPSQQASLLEVAVEHVQHIAGNVSSAPFSYIGNTAPRSASEGLLELLLWTLDHPLWERRDSGAAMLLWVARHDDGLYRELAQLAVSMDNRNRADIASAVLDILSREDSVGLWQRIEPHVQIAQVVEQCQHVSRYATLMRIAERASKQKVESATTALTLLRTPFAESCPNPTPALKGPPPPMVVPSTLHSLWRELFNIGVLSEEALQAFGAQMARLCSPLSIDTARELESLVARGGREQPDLSTGRWATTVRYALNLALFQSMPASKLRVAEGLLRLYNPECPPEPANGRELLHRLVACLGGRERSYTPAQGNLVFLNFECFLEMAGDTAHVELVSSLVPPGQSREIRLAPQSFKATELPHPGPEEPISVCGRGRPTIAYFGSLSPAIATPRFLRLVGATASKTIRYHWRDGLTVKSVANSRRHEAVLLAIEREELDLPSGWQLRWELRVNGEVRAVLTKF